jgi:hypothetical protein
MLLGFFTVVITLIVAYVFYLEGAVTACAMFCNTVLAGLIAFNFWEPLADVVGPTLNGTFLAGFEDAFCLIALFAIPLGLLRLTTNSLTNKRVELPMAVQTVGGVLFGLATGYLTAGFLLCMLQTLPWHENFMHFDARYDSGSEQAVRRVMPPDRVWLALMYRAGAVPFCNEEDPRQANSSNRYLRYQTFDQYGSFELRYARYRRFDNKGQVKDYRGEFDEELHRQGR